MFPCMQHILKFTFCMWLRWTTHYSNPDFISARLCVKNSVSIMDKNVYFQLDKYMAGLYALKLTADNRNI